MQRLVYAMGLCASLAGCNEPGDGGPADAAGSTGTGGDETATSDPSDPTDASAPDDDGDTTAADETTTGPDPTEATTTTGSTGSVDDTGTGDPTTAPDEVPPMGIDELLPWLEAGEYLDWAPESGPHPSDGPHFGTVRAFINGPLLESLDAGGDPHPVDASAVKELYGAGDEVLGWSVSIKIAEGAGGDTWYWLEYYNGTTYADGVGDELCTGCHGAGTDHFLSPYPLQ